MKQVLLSGKGEISVFDVPLPGRLPDSILVRNAFSLISAGTESAAVASRPGWLGVLEKANRSRDKVLQTWRMAQKQGVRQTWSQVLGRLEDWSALGYSSSGQVVEVSGAGGDFRPGDRVACMGVGYASHAEYIVVPRNLAAPIPEGVSAAEASFGAVACIAQQGVRILNRTPGECLVVVGLGLIGALAAGLARAMGYQVLGLDLDPRRAGHVADWFGVPAWGLGDVNARAEILRRTDGRGADGVLVAAATPSDEPVNLAFDLCRQKGVVAVVGDVGLSLDRAKMYRKELELRMSCSYGPGRYDSRYEEQGEDYPAGYVRWTERRNLSYFLHLLERGDLSLEPMISQLYAVTEAPQAYSRLKQSRADTYGVLFRYPEPEIVVMTPPREAYTIQVHTSTSPSNSDLIRLGIIGCGAFAKGVHLPILARMADTFQLRSVASRSGASAATTARRFRIGQATSDYRLLLEDPEVDAVLIATRHAQHAELVCQALQAGKHVLVEKPLCLTSAEGRRIEQLAQQTGRIVRVGFNRRHSPYLRAMRQALGTSGPRMFTARVCIAPRQLEHWSNTREEGGRFLGEAVHFLDLSNWFLGQYPLQLQSSSLGPADPMNPNLAVVLRYADGSLGQLVYNAAGDAAIGKELYEAFGNSRAARCHDFTSLWCSRGGARIPRRQRGDKGFGAQWTEFAAAIRGNPSPEGADATAGRWATTLALQALADAGQPAADTWVATNRDHDPGELHVA